MSNGADFASTTQPNTQNNAWRHGRAVSQAHVHLINSREKTPLLQ